MQPRDHLRGLTHERLLALLHYEPATGAFTWRVTIGPNAQAGSAAGSVNSAGYRKVKIDGVDYYMHRLAWLYVNGEWPVDRIDHENLDKGDLRWDNLRPATYAENIRNRPVQKNTRSGLKGVHYAPTRTSFKKWAAHIRVDGVLKTLGYFALPEEAHAAYAKAAEAAFGEFARS